MFLQYIPPREGSGERRGFAHVAPVERFIGQMGNVIVVIYPLTFCRPFTSEVRMD